MMSPQTHERFLEECAKAWENAEPEHREAVFLLLINEAAKTRPLADKAAESGLHSLSLRTCKYLATHIGAALALGWDGGPTPGKPGTETG